MFADDANRDKDASLGASVPDPAAHMRSDTHDLIRPDGEDTALDLESQLASQDQIDLFLLTVPVDPAGLAHVERKQIHAETDDSELRRQRDRTLPRVERKREAQNPFFAE